MSEDTNDTNDQLVLVVGYSGTGKSASLMNIRDQERWLYLNCEAGKRLPFKNRFDGHRIEEPYQVHEAFDHATNNPAFDGIIVDSLTFLMDMFETQYVIGAADTMRGWSNYAQFFKVTMQQKVTALAKPTIFTAHVKDLLDEKSMEMKTMVPIKGSTKDNGVEAYFSTVVAAKKIVVKDLKDYDKDLLHITDEDKDLGYKHVFQTRPTAKTTGERLRSPMGLFNKQQTYIDNDCQLLLDHLDEFYR